ncbi:MAG: hypothetical protein SOW59_03855 [Corynebacterium sp.]|nr:hypothetical protein [Corynebacterium sp.]
MTDVIFTSRADTPTADIVNNLQEVTPVPGLPELDGDAHDLVLTHTVEDGHAALAAKIEAFIHTHKVPFRPVTVLIDGPSGAGKTWFAVYLTEKLGYHTVHMDEFYPGWHGLAEGRDMVYKQVLRLHNPGYWRWDWHANILGDWVSLDERDDVVIEGVGALSAENIAAAKQRGLAVTIMITGPRQDRFSWAIERDPDYEPWFEAWEQQESAHFTHLRETEVTPDFVLAWAQ